MNDASLLFDDEFTILTVDAPTKKFDRVSRVTASSSDKNMELVLDIHNEQYPLLAGTKITLALAKSLTQEGEKGGGAEAQSWRLDQNSEGLAKDWEYIMYGKLYKFDSGASETVTCYVSFGGLLMALTGDYRHLDRLTVGQMLFLLIRK